MPIPTPPNASRYALNAARPICADNRAPVCVPSAVCNGQRKIFVDWRKDIALNAKIFQYLLDATGLFPLPSPSLLLQLSRVVNKPYHAESLSDILNLKEVLLFSIFTLPLHWIKMFLELHGTITIRTVLG